MPLEVRDIQPDPTLDLVATDAVTGVQRRVTTYSGAATVAPVVQPGGFQIRVSTQVIGQPPPGLAPSAPWGVPPTTLDEHGNQFGLTLLGDYWRRPIPPDYRVARATTLDRLARDDARK
ncbi:MAG: hypothetical protein ACEQSX_13225, partial [Baekduiaceae bacterium]